MLPAIFHFPHLTGSWWCFETWRDSAPSIPAPGLFLPTPSLKGSSISELPPDWHFKALLSHGSLLVRLSFSPWWWTHCGLTTAWCLPPHSKLGTVESVPKQRRLFLRCPCHLFRKMLKQHDEVGQTHATQELTSGLWWGNLVSLCKVCWWVLHALCEALNYKRKGRQALHTNYRFLHQANWLQLEFPQRSLLANLSHYYWKGNGNQGLEGRKQ